MARMLSSDWRGASVIIPSKGGFLWAISKPNLWKVVHGKSYVSFSGIGGGVEDRESFEGAALRECREETGCELRITRSLTTYILDEVEGSVSEQNEDTRPFMIWRKKLVGRKTLVVYTYLGRITGTPRPKQEVPALLYAPIEELFRHRTPTIREVIEGGSLLVGRERIPRSAFLRPWGTPCYLRELARRGCVDLSMLART